MKKRILIIEDEYKITEILKLYLEREGFQVLYAKTGMEGLRLFRDSPPHLVILDLMLPDIDGEEIAGIIKKNPDIPVIMLTAKSSEEERVSGLELGADDYIIKPFSPREVVARVKAVMRRYGTKKDIKSFNGGRLIIDTVKREVTMSGKNIHLTKKEFLILNLLSERPGKIFTREEIIESIFEDEYEGYDRTVDAHIKNLRQKLGDDPKNPTLIKTVYGTGYKFMGRNDEE